MQSPGLQTKDLGYRSFTLANRIGVGVGGQELPLDQIPSLTSHHNHLFAHTTSQAWTVCQFEALDRKPRGLQRSKVLLQEPIKWRKGAHSPLRQGSMVGGGVQREVSSAYGPADAAAAGCFLPAGANLTQTPVPHALGSSVLLRRAAAAGTPEQVQRPRSSRRPRDSTRKGVMQLPVAFKTRAGQRSQASEAPPPGAGGFRLELLLEPQKRESSAA